MGPKGIIAICRWLFFGNKMHELSNLRFSEGTIGITEVKFGFLAWQVVIVAETVYLLVVLIDNLQWLEKLP